MELEATQIESKEEQVQNEVQEQPKKKKKTSLADFKVKSFMTDVKVGQVQFLKTVGG